MGKIKELIKLCRPWQWYKNLLVFLALIFTSQLFDTGKLELTFLGFISLSAISSANYIINDIVDRKTDKYHPEKKNRPIAAGKVSITEGAIMFVILSIISLSISLYLGTMFTICVVTLFLLTQAYSFFLKNELFLDILTIAILFVIRAVSGAFIIDVKISPWLILCTFFLSLFLSTSKRTADFLLIGKKAHKHKKVLKYYNQELNDTLVIITTAMLIISYSLYSFFSDFSWLLATLPIALYTILRYNYLVKAGSVIGRRPEMIYKDIRMMISVGTWGLLAFVAIYLV